jgi:uncharacterized membrane protein YhhN
MKKSAKIAGAVFLLLSLVDVLSVFVGGNDIHLYVKPLLMPSLAAAALCQLLPGHNCRLTWLLVIGLCFHTAGDVLLNIDGFLYFALGLGAFLIGHWFYLGVLLSGIGVLKGWKEILCLAVPLVLAPVIVGFFGVEWPFSAAVILYAFTLMVVAASGILWNLRGRQFASRIFWGGIIFIISDSLIALKSFAGIDFALRSALVMPTYLLAEWLLVSGMVRGRLLISGDSSK